jgi:hypothetical protein
MTSSTENSAPQETNLDVDDISIESPLIEESTNEDISDALTDLEIGKEIENLAERKTEWLDIYKILIDTRKFEIDNFWKRTVFFWGTIAILLAGYFNAKNSEHFLIFVSYIGLFYNLIFSFSLRGSKYWQEHWEQASLSYERALKIRLFRWKLTNRIQEETSHEFFLLRPYRFSVSKLTMILSDITLTLWFILIAKDISFLLRNNFLHFDFALKNNIDYFTIAVFIIPTIYFIYLGIFLHGSWTNRRKTTPNIGFCASVA